jgi:hypothetical protein
MTPYILERKYYASDRSTDFTFSSLSKKGIYSPLNNTTIGIGLSGLETEPEI